MHHQIYEGCSDVNAADKIKKLMELYREVRIAGDLLYLTLAMKRNNGFQRESAMKSYAKKIEELDEFRLLISK